MTNIFEAAPASVTPARDGSLAPLAILAQKCVYTGSAAKSNACELDAYLRLIFELRTLSESDKLLIAKFVLAIPVLLEWSSFADSNGPYMPPLKYDDPINLLAVKYEPMSPRWEALNRGHVAPIR
ncbi:hypothetical protein GGI07_004851 [Coemansia sp. Benny D115]|nr:hypothetical protein GGI07_004851 [Coemansia sp. Benny D115]